MPRHPPTHVEYTQTEAVLTPAPHGAIYAATVLCRIAVYLFHAFSPVTFLCTTILLWHLHPYLLGRPLRVLQGVLQLLCVVWRWYRKQCAMLANPVTKPDDSMVAVRFLQVVVRFRRVVWRWFRKHCDAPANPVVSREDSIVIFLDGKEVYLPINLPDLAIAVTQIPVNTPLSPSLRPASPKYTSSAVQSHTSPPPPTPRSGTLEENVQGPAAETSSNVVLSDSTTNEAAGRAAKLVSSYAAHLTAPSLPSPPTPAPTSSKPQLSVDAAASLPAQCERGAEAKLEGCVSASSVTKPSSTSLPSPPVLVVTPASSSSKAQLPVHASIERLSDHLDIKPLHHEETKIKQPQPASLKHSCTNHDLPAFTPAPAIGNKSLPPAKSRGDPIRHIPAPIPSQPPNEGCSRPQPVINPHSPGLASNANFGVNIEALKPLRAFDVESQAPVSHPLSNGAPSEGSSNASKELEASNAQVVAARDELRKQNQQLEYQFEGLPLTCQGLAESDAREVSVLKSLFREREERWAKHQDEREKFRNARVEALMEARARLNETWSELQTMQLARIETLETQLMAKETQCFSVIAHAEKLCNDGFAEIHREVDQLKAQITDVLL